MVKFDTLFWYLPGEAEEPGYRSRYSDWLRAGRLRGRSSSPDTIKNFLYSIQTGSGAQPATYPMGTGGSFPGGKAVGT
jgi:hypothetical protein